ncbi:spore coat U domain-containing protein [Brucella sp. TWI559]
MQKSAILCKIGLGAVLICFPLYPAAVIAQTNINGNLSVEITIQNECSLDTIAGVNFGTTGLLATEKTQAGEITVTCTKGASFALALDEGLGTGATEAMRLMTKSGGTETVEYSLYRDAQHTLLWGSATNGYSGTGTGASQTLNVYGRVPAQDTPSAGVYQDTVQVTLTY